MRQVSTRESLVHAFVRIRTLLLILFVPILTGCASTFPAYKYPGLPTPREGATHFIVFDVGQADCMLVLNDGRSMLVDAGVSRSREDRDDLHEVARRIEALTGGRRLDYLVVTHYHEDHIGKHVGRSNTSNKRDTGLWELLDQEGFTVGTLIDRGSLTYGYKGGTQKHYEATVPRWLQDARVGTHRVVRAGEQIDMGKGLVVDVIAASGNDVLSASRARDPATFEAWPPSENDYSIALKFTKGNFELFSAGDLSGHNVQKRFGPITMSYNDVESAIAGNVGDVEVYRVDHHGSDNSTNPCFLSVLHPEVSIFSTGVNTYGHPTIRVYDAAKALGDTYITGGADSAVLSHVQRDVVNGDVEIMVSADGERYWVNGKTYLSIADAAEKARTNAVFRCQTPPRSANAPDSEDTDAD